MHRRTERGAAMILALAFIIVIGVLAAALIGFAFTASANTRVYREQRVVRYNAESAINLTIVQLEMEPPLGTAPNDCDLDFDMNEELGNGEQQILATGSVLTVECSPISTGSYAPVVPSGGVDSDGGQAPRVVLITVHCIGPGAPPDNRSVLACTGSGASDRVVAEARVRFEIDYTAADQNERAVVPKILTFDSQR